MIDTVFEERNEEQRRQQIVQLLARTLRNIRDCKECSDYQLFRLETGSHILQPVHSAEQQGEDR